jgi:hypothetical protein
LQISLKSHGMPLEHCKWHNYPGNARALRFISIYEARRPFMVTFFYSIEQLYFIGVGVRCQSKNKHHKDTCVKCDWTACVVFFYKIILGSIVKAIWRGGGQWSFNELKNFHFFILIKNKIFIWVLTIMRKMAMDILDLDKNAQFGDLSWYDTYIDWCVVLIMCTNKARTQNLWTILDSIVNITRVGVGRPIDHLTRKK